MVRDQLGLPPRLVFLLTIESIVGQADNLDCPRTGNRLGNAPLTRVSSSTGTKDSSSRIVMFMDRPWLLGSSVLDTCLPLRELGILQRSSTDRVTQHLLEINSQLHRILTAQMAFRLADPHHCLHCTLWQAVAA